MGIAMVSTICRLRDRRISLAKRSLRFEHCWTWRSLVRDGVYAGIDEMARMASLR
jgi:hypothetical protein